MVEQPGVDTFMIIGDTGEQDPSQYVVCPPLSDAVREHSPGFVMIMSDVIYPAGHVDDYVDGVYRPYRGEAPHFRVEAPLPRAFPATTTGTTGWPASCSTSRSGPTAAGRVHPAEDDSQVAAGPAVPHPVAAAHRSDAADPAPP